MQGGEPATPDDKEQQIVEWIEIYGAVLALHAASTFSSYRPAWPMLAACIALYMLRDFDTIAAVEKPRAA